MPTYVYKFLETGETVEVQQSFADATLTEAVHPRTGEVMAVKKVFQPVGVTFKGDGFYKTDSRATSKSGARSDTSDTSDTSGTSGSSSTAEGAAAGGGGGDSGGGDKAGSGGDSKKAADTPSTSSSTSTTSSSGSSSKGGTPTATSTA
jgi:predicted nucleic acid-binding Zn ribbon protein